MDEKHESIKASIHRKNDRSYFFVNVEETHTPAAQAFIHIMDPLLQPNKYLSKRFCAESLSALYECIEKMHGIKRTNLTIMKYDVLVQAIAFCPDDNPALFKALQRKMNSVMHLAEDIIGGYDQYNGKNAKPAPDKHSRNEAFKQVFASVVDQIQAYLPEKKAEDLIRALHENFIDNLAQNKELDPEVLKKINHKKSTAEVSDSPAVSSSTALPKDFYPSIHSPRESEEEGKTTLKRK